MSSVKVAIEDVVAEKGGTLIVALFESKEDYLKKAVKSTTVQPDVKSVTFDEVPKGRYAVSVVHDVNENGKLDTNWIGLPKEPFGFSNKSMGTFGPPSFNDTSFNVDDDIAVTVKVISLL